MNHAVMPDVLLSESCSFPSLLRTEKSFKIGIFHLTVLAHLAARPVNFLVRRLFLGGFYALLYKRINYFHVCFCSWF